MTPHTRTLIRRLAVTAGGAALGYAVSGASARQALRAPLALLAVASVGNLMAQASTASKTRAVEARLNAHVAATAPAVNFVANGGTVGGSVTAAGLTTSGGYNCSGNINMNGNNINSIGSLGGNGGNIGLTNGLAMSGANNINMDGGSLNVLGGMNGSQPHRADLGTQTFNAAGLNAVQARVDYYNDSLVAAGIFS